MQQIGQTDDYVWKVTLFVLFIPLCLIIRLILAWFYTKLILKAFREI